MLKTSGCVIEFYKKYKIVHKGQYYIETILFKGEIVMYSIPSTRYTIDEDFIIRNFSGEVCNFPEQVLESGERLVQITIFGETEYKSVIWLYYLAKFDIHIAECARVIQFVKTPVKRHGEYVFPIHTKPVYYNDTDYRIVPGYCDIAVNRYGECINICTGKIYKPYSNAVFQYQSIQIFLSYGRKITLFVHRLAALAWIHNDSPQEKYIVNHKDGNKRNNVITNLEWVTGSENVRHAIKARLKVDNKKCRLRDVQTGEIHEFDSYGQAKAFLNTFQKCTVDLGLKTNINFLHLGRFEFRSFGDTRPWFYENKTTNEIRSKAKFIIKVTDSKGKVEYLFGMPNILKYLNLNPNNHGISIHSAIGMLKRKHPDCIVEIINTRRDEGRLVQCLNLETNKVEEFPSIQKVMERFGLTGNTAIRAALLSNGSRVFNNCRFRYKPEKDIPWPAINTNQRVLPSPIQIKNKRTGEIIECDSIRKAAKTLGVSKDKIHRLLRSPLDEDEYVLFKL